jgi:hypothetical protein
MRIVEPRVQRVGVSVEALSSCSLRRADARSRPLACVDAKASASNSSRRDQPAKSGDANTPNTDETRRRRTSASASFGSVRFGATPRPL